MKSDPFLHAALQGRTLDGEFIVDAHAHMGPWPAFPVLSNDAHSMIQAMDRIGVSIVCPAAHASVGPDFKLGNDLIASAQQRFPGRIVGYIGINPWYGQRQCLAELRRCQRKGMRNIKIHSIHGRPYDDPPYHAAYAYAAERNWTILAHTWGDPATCSTIARIARQYPSANFLLAHTGAVSYDEYLRAADAAPNVFLELALSNAPYGLVAEFVRRIGAERIVFGSDLPFLSLAHQIGKVLCAEISPDDKRKILGLNARRILRL